MIPDDEIALLKAENALLRRKLAMRTGLHVAHYAANTLGTLYELSERSWLDRMHQGLLGPVGQAGGPINVTPDSKRPSWRIPGDKVWEFFMQEPIMAETEEVIFARTPGELKRKAAA